MVKWRLFDCHHIIARNWRLRTSQERRLRNLFNLATFTNTVDKRSGKIQESEVNHSSVVRFEKYKFCIKSIFVFIEWYRS